MKTLDQSRTAFRTGLIDKPTYIQSMYEDHHAVLFDYAKYLTHTNIRKIEIEADSVVMTTRDRGIRLACVSGDHRIAPIETLNFLDYEKEEAAMMESLIADGDNYFDIGANIGYYSLNIAAARRNSNIYCFEPIPGTFNNLKANIALNSFRNISVFNFGFSDKAGEFPFYFYPEGSGNASSANVTGRSDVQIIPCSVRTLDDYIRETNLRVDFIKCDVEGAELLVFKGGIDTLKKDKPVVFSEILRKWSAKFNYHPNEIFELFRQLGYRAFTVKNGKLENFETMNESTLETNFFFLHSQKHQDRINRFFGA